MNKKNLIWGIVIFVAALIISSSPKINNETQIDLKPTVKPLSMHSVLNCKTTKASTHDFKKNFMLSELDTNEPKMIFLDEYGGTQPWDKMFESDKTLTIGMVASWTGSTDTITLNKLTGEFSRSSTSLVAGSFSSEGICK